MSPAAPADLGPFSVAYFFEEWHRFYAIMHSREIPSTQKGLAFGALFMVILNLDATEPEDERRKAQDAWNVARAEFTMRNALEIMRPLYGAPLFRRNAP